jgi:hypothetical protein
MAKPKPGEPGWKYPWQRHRGAQESPDAQTVWIKVGDGFIRCRDPMAGTPPVRDPLDDPASGYGEPNG